MVSSATATAFIPGQLQTRMPRSAAALISIVSKPEPARMMSLRFFAAAWISLGTLVERTVMTSGSNSAIRCLSVLSLRSGSYESSSARPLS
jgi:hypothetical protein